MNYYTQYPATESIRNFLYKVYGWMATGLALTAGTAYYVFSNQSLFQYLFGHPFILILLIIGQFAAVIALSAFVQRLDLPTAIGIFLGYSLLTGITLSSVFLLYRIEAIYLSFGITSAMFATMALYGYFTKSDLTSVGSIARMGLFGIIIAMLVNMFLRSAEFDYIISLIGVGIFTLLIAYDSQKIKQLGHMLLGQGEMLDKVALLGALTLYLDFINLFLFLLRIIGGRRED